MTALPRRLPLARREFALTVAAVVAVHLAALLAFTAPRDPAPEDASAPQLAALRTRSVAPAAPSPPTSGHSGDAAPARWSGPAAAVAAAPRAANASAAGTAAAAAAASAAAAAAAERPEPIVALAEAVRREAAPAADELPTYRTRPPPPLAYRYEVQRGADRGELELRWSRDGERYEASLEARLAGAPWLELASRGGFDAAGIAPERHTDRRRGRSLQAANFQRDAGRISFSGPALTHVLVAGAQDRLSWLLQLAAIVAADPGLAAPGGAISFVVVGVRGDAELWTFAASGDEALERDGLPAARALHLLRQPLRPYDTRAEVWLAPELHYLPLRVRLSNPPSARGAMQLDWREALAPR